MQLLILFCFHDTDVFRPGSSLQGVNGFRRRSSGDVVTSVFTRDWPVVHVRRDECAHADVSSQPEYHLTSAGTTAGYNGSPVTAITLRRASQSALGTAQSI